MEHFLYAIKLNQITKLQIIIYFHIWSIWGVPVIYRHVKLIHTTVADCVRVLRRGLCLASFAIDWTEIKPIRTGEKWMDGNRGDGWNGIHHESIPKLHDFVCFSTLLFLLEVKREQTV